MNLYYFINEKPNHPQEDETELIPHESKSSPVKETRKQGFIKKDKRAKYKKKVMKKDDHEFPPL